MFKFPYFLIFLIIILFHVRVIESIAFCAITSEHRATFGRKFSVKETSVIFRRHRIHGALFYDIAHLFPTNYATSKHSYITVMIDECFRPRSCNSAGGGCLVLDALPTIDSSIITVTSSKRPVCCLESRGNGKQKQNGKRNRSNEKEKIRFRHMPFA